MGVSAQRHAPAALYPREKTPIPIVQDAEWASEQVWTQRLEEKYFTLPRIEFLHYFKVSDPRYRQEINFE
jgi:hypothetical protein